MFNLTRKGLWAHKVRFLLTGLAVVLGVAFMAGTFVLTDTIRNSINSLIGSTAGGRSAIVRGVSQFASTGVRTSQDSLSGNVRPLVPESLLATVRSVPGVAAADGSVQGVVSLVGSDGKGINTGNSRAPTVAASRTPWRGPRSWRSTPPPPSRWPASPATSARSTSPVPAGRAPTSSSTPSGPPCRRTTRPSPRPRPRRRRPPPSTPSSASSTPSSWSSRSSPCSSAPSSSSTPSAS